MSTIATPPRPPVESLLLKPLHPHHLRPPLPPASINPPPQSSTPPSFSPTQYLTSLLESSSLSSLLQTYTRLLSEIRALDAEKKALVYNNYSKLITATETIRKMRTTMDPLNPMAGTIDLVVGRVYDMARGLREEMREHCGGEQGRRQGGGGMDRKKRTKELVREVYRGMERMRGLCSRGTGRKRRRSGNCRGGCWLNGRRWGGRERGQGSC
ncbi:hypothetical protein QC764_508840 [Podospora pseudoanserina]|uniref:Vacuolar protein sorting-associated protein 51 homolog n=1 Tax=Podospora pseudoanserina TaxID=2609844 RepID=A0ABR0I7E3_9PEZI|nr:hypothetical protein QC764_508840 [Podospora pseudoanserina]